ncbi:type II toxin-antitoxin system VapC family toxin [Pantoea latae]|uniref:Ribonuclease VapC n=1 Tax=Pantoea latae TaxID=1964541 RepID=A0A1V9DKD2_9GAMM|nr:type II toxin-antitoxin system VapC family toxin [Pantoea latae]OQP34306.1 VapC toxin family PIN domain ribonuclease [Pantoea latae]
MRYLLDTNVISELRKARTRAIDTAVSAWTDSVDAGDMFLSVITIMEIEKGIAQMARRDLAQAARLRTWFETAVLREFNDRILPFDVDAARYCARLHVPDKRAANDAIIAAIAWQHDMVLVTRNLKDFTGMGAQLLNPWEWP